MVKPYDHIIDPRPGDYQRAYHRGLTASPGARNPYLADVPHPQHFHGWRDGWRDGPGLAVGAREYPR